MSEIRKGEGFLLHVGILGGTFDPVHIGHLMLAEAALNQFALDEIWFLPAGQPSFKPNRIGRADNQQRIDMVRLATEGNSNFKISLHEMEQKGTSYTSQTLTALRRMHPHTWFYFIMGADCLFEFQEWKNPKMITENATILVASRGEGRDEALREEIERQAKYFDGDFRFLDAPYIDLSSTLIRKSIADGKSIRYLVPEAVRLYIEEQEIYQDTV